MMKLLDHVGEDGIPEGDVAVIYAQVANCDSLTPTQAQLLDKNLALLGAKKMKWDTAKLVILQTLRSAAPRARAASAESFSGAVVAEGISLPAE